MKQKFLICLDVIILLCLQIAGNNITKRSFGIRNADAVLN